MSMLLSMMMEQANEIYPPADVVFTRSGEGVKIGNRSYLKDYNGLAYGGVIFFKSTSGNWKGPMFVSESRDACMNKGAGQYQSTISTTTFNYKGKDWYYVTASAAMPSNNSTTNYLINSTLFSGTTEEQYLQAAKALLDYVYSFTISQYIQVDYIQSTGTQYIDTKVVPNSETGLNFAMSNSNFTADYNFIGCRIAGGQRFAVNWNNNNWGYGFNNYILTDFSANQNIKNDFSLNFYNSKKFIVNDKSVDITDNITVTLPTVYLFGQHVSTTSAFFAYNLYFCQISQDSTLIRDYIPMYCLILQKYGMLDRITKCFCLNNGTGDFLGGSY